MKGVTKANSVDHYARRKIDELADLASVAKLLPHYKLWAKKELPVGTTLDKFVASDFTAEAGMPSTIVGATQLLITVEHIRGSAGGSLYTNKGLQYKVTDTDDKVCAWLYDTNILVGNEAFKCLNDLDGSYYSELSCYTAQGTTYANSTAGNALYYTKEIGHRETGEILAKPKIKNFEITFGTNKAVYQIPMIVSVYASFD